MSKFIWTIYDTKINMDNVIEFSFHKSKNSGDEDKYYVVADAFHNGEMHSLTISEHDTEVDAINKIDELTKSNIDDIMPVIENIMDLLRKIRFPISMGLS